MLEQSCIALLKIGIQIIAFAGYVVLAAENLWRLPKIPKLHPGEVTLRGNELPLPETLA